VDTRRQYPGPASPLECSLATSGIPSGRFIGRFFEYEPRVGVIGGLSTKRLTSTIYFAAREDQASYPGRAHRRSKSRAVIDAVPDDLVLGYSRGYADRLLLVLRPADWKGSASSSVGVLNSSTPFDS